MKFFLQIVIFLFLGSNIYAQKSSESYTFLESGFKKLTFTKQSVFSEKEYKSNIFNVIKNDTAFNHINKKYINQGIYNKSHWIKINLINLSKTEDFIFEFNQVNIDSLKLFVVANNKVNKKFKTKGLHFSKNNKESFLSIKYGYVYNLKIKNKDSVSIYINAIVNDDPFRVSNTIWSIEHYKTKEKQIQKRSAYLLIFLGLVLLILAMSFTMFLFTFKKLYLYYFGFVIVIFANLLCMRSFISPVVIEKYFFLGNNYSDMFGYVQIFFIALYTNEFFGLKKIKPNFSKFISFTALFTSLLFIMALFLRKEEWFYGFSYAFSKIFMVFMCFILYGLAINLALKKKLMAYYYIVAYTPLLILLVIIY